MTRYPWWRAADEDPDAVAFIDENGVHRWGDAATRIDALILYLRSAGLGPGDRVALIAANSAGWMESFLAVCGAGIHLVPINWHLTPSEIGYILDDARPGAIIVDPAHTDTVRRAMAEADHAIPVRIVTGADGFEDFLPLDSIPGPHHRMAPGTADVVGDVMFYTSGTSGRPKGVIRRGIAAPCITEMAALGEAFAQRFDMPADGVSLVCGPLYHSGQLGFARWPVFAGRSTLLMERFDAHATLVAIDDIGVTNTHMVPTQFVRMLRLPAEVRDAFDGSSLRTVIHGGAPCAPETKRAMIDWWGPKLVEYYGTTETLLVSMATSEEWLQRPGTVGRPDDVEVVVLGDDGRVLPAGEIGTLHYRSSTGADFAYRGDPGKTQAAHTIDGLATVGDIGHLDTDGYVYLADRRTDLILSGGVNIYPAEVEAVLVAHPAVADAAVVGLSDEEYGQRPHALVEIVEGAAEVTAVELVDHCRSRLAGFKVPDSITFVANLPRSEAGKLLKAEIRDQLVGLRDQALGT